MSLALGSCKMRAMHKFCAAAIAAVLISTTGCAGTPKANAQSVGELQKEGVDVIVSWLKAYVDMKADKCLHLTSKVELVACLGPVAANPDEVDAAIELARTAQVAYYVALTSTGPDGDVSVELLREAENQLVVAAEALVVLVKKAKGL